MSRSNCRKRIWHVGWTILITVTLVFFSLFAYHIIVVYDRFCLFHKEDCPTVFKSEAAMQQGGTCENICDSAECIAVSKSILRKMNPEVDPCEDFYEFACGRYDANFGKEENAPPLFFLQDHLYLATKDVIETSTKTKTRGSAAKKLKTVYDSCMDIKSSELTGTRTLLRFLASSHMPHWPVLDENFTFAPSDRAFVLARLAVHEETLFLAPAEVRKIRNSDGGPDPAQKVDVMHISQPVQFPHATEKELMRVVPSIFQQIRADSRASDDVWRDFRKISIKLDELRQNNWEVGAECKEDRGHIIDCSTEESKKENMLCRYVNFVLMIANVQGVSKDHIYVKCTDEHYMQNLPMLLDSFTDRELANNIALKVFLHNLMNSNFLIRKKLLPFMPSTEGEKVPLERWKFCLSWVIENMPAAVSHLYAAERFTQEKLEEVDEMVNSYKAATIAVLRQMEWTDQWTKIELMAKVHSIENEFTLVNNWYKNETIINEHYGEFTASRHSFMENVLRLKKMRFPFLLKGHFEINIRNLLFKISASSGENIQFSYGIFFPPVFTSGYPKFVRLGSFGFIVGHEINHETAWFFFRQERESFNGGTIFEFGRRSQCFASEYSEFEDEETGIRANGNFTIYEDAPDIFGMYVSEKLLDKILHESNERMMKLPGLPYSAKQLFYLTFAQVWCESLSKESRTEHLKRNMHSISRQRVKIPLRHSNDFPKAFGCPAGSGMNPREKCSYFY